jgi:hypothetical protein
MTLFNVGDIVEFYNSLNKNIVLGEILKIFPSSSPPYAHVKSSKTGIVHMPNLKILQLISTMSGSAPPAAPQAPSTPPAPKAAAAQHQFKPGDKVTIAKIGSMWKGKIGTVVDAIGRDVRVDLNGKVRTFVASQLRRYVTEGMPSKTKATERSDACKHEYKLYIGLRECYEFCIHCDRKRVPKES